MPSTQKSLQLIKLSSKQVSNQIVNLCTRYSEWHQILDIISNERLGAELKTFTDMKQAYDLPLQIKKDILDECLQKWTVDKTEFSGSAREVSHFLIHYFCLDKTSVWSYVFRSEVDKCVDALVKFNPNLVYLHVTAGIDVTLLERTISNMCNIMILELDNAVSEEYFALIGKYCTNLTRLKAAEDSGSISKSSALKLCFKDYPQNSIKNGLCSTLYLIIADATVQTTLILLENVPNLKIISVFLKLDYSDLVSSLEKDDKRGFPCKIELIRALKFPEMIPFHELYRDFPHLKILFLSSNIPQSIISNLNVNVLVLYNSYSTYTPMFVMPPWTNLRLLALEFPSENQTNVDVCSIAKGCPNLQLLSLSYCKEKTGEMFVPFRNLEELILKNESIDSNLIVLNQTAANLKSLWVIETDNYVAFEDSSLYQVLTSMSFPCLESLKCIPEINSSTEEILEFLNHLPNLKTFGSVTDEDLCSDLEEEFTLRNWDLKLSDSNVNVTFTNYCTYEK